MSFDQQTNEETYRLIVTRRNASEILLLPGERGTSLPCVEILRGRRVVEQLTAELYARHGWHGYCLFVPNFVSGTASCAVMEAIGHDPTTSVALCWKPLDEATRSAMESEDHMVVERSLEELEVYRREPNQAPFSRPGWLEELFAWTRSQIDPLGLRATGTIRQLNASPTFSLIRMETTGPAIWFKATGEPNRHEPPIAVALARLFPGYVPRILGVHSSWNGWLSEDAPGTLLDDCEESFAWERVARQLAELQLASAGKSTELLDNSCKDLRLPGLVKMVDPFLARMADLMAVQVKASPKPLTTSGFNLLGERLKEACALLHELDLPDTLGHVDFNPGNIVVSPSVCCFLDWAEGCVSHPFLTFEYLREHARRRLGEDGAAIERIAAAYLGPWQSEYSPEIVRQAMVLSPLVAVFGAAVNDSALRSVDPLQNARVAGYFRSLTRRMFREAAEITKGKERCVS
jgi:hypothetical protein